MAKKTTPNNYGNESITSLKGADRVRKRPAVIFGSDGIEGCQHSVFEILSGAASLLTTTKTRNATTGSLYSVSFMQAANTSIMRPKAMNFLSV